MYIEILVFGRTYYLHLGRQMKNRWCVYLISWGQLWFDDNFDVEHATLHGIFSSLK